MLKRDNKYYFMWSEGSWGGSDYSVAYAIADSPFGPFKRIGKILQQDEKVGTGAGHHSVIQIPGKGRVVYCLSSSSVGRYSSESQGGLYRPYVF